MDHNHLLHKRDHNLKVISLKDNDLFQLKYQCYHNVHKCTKRFDIIKSCVVVYGPCPYAHVVSPS